MNDKNEAKNIIEERESESPEFDRAESIKLETILREEKNLQELANLILEGTYRDHDIFKKDSIDRFLDFVISKVRTGSYYIPSLAFPTRRMSDKYLEAKIIKLLNEYLYPEIILPILKYLTRNVKDADRNLYLANLIESDGIIKAIYDTFLLFKKDIFITDPDKRTLNVKRIQQFPPTSENSISSPLDAACRFKYVLEYLALIRKVDHIYTAEQIRMSG